MESHISGEAVLAFLKTRGSRPNFYRDTLEVDILNDSVEIHLFDRLSGGSTSHATGMNPVAFEAKYNPNGA